MLLKVVVRMNSMNVNIYGHDYVYSSSTTDITHAHPKQTRIHTQTRAYTHHANTTVFVGSAGRPE